MKPILEIVCDSLISSIRAARAGADRIELCENLGRGGVTPSAAKIKLIREKVAIPIYVLIRPREADFCYSDLEFEILLEDIRLAKDLGADGIVSGALQPDGLVDFARTRQMQEAAFPLSFTFHRAFDRCRDPLEAIDRLADLGVERILTSGQRPNALEGKENIRQFVQRAGGTLSIMAGSGVRAGNIRELMDVEGLMEFHSAARTTVRSRMDYFGAEAPLDEPNGPEFHWQEVDEEEVRKMRAVLNRE